MLLSSTNHLVLWRSCNFSFLIRLAGVSCFHSSSLILSSFPSFLNWRAVWNPSYPLCHSFNSSGGIVLLFSSSIIPSSQVHVLFLPCSTGVLPEFFLSHLVLTGVVSIPSCPLYSSFIALQPPRFTWCLLFLFVLPQCCQLCSTPLCSFFQLFNLSRIVVSLVCQRSNLVLPALFLFHFPLRCHSRSRDEILS